MIPIALRTLFVYLMLMLFLRLLGKRQVGQLEVGELVTALLLSELAAFPIADPDIPLIYAAVPVLLIVFLELLSACLCAAFPRVKRLIEGAPAILVSQGKLDQKELARCRLSPDELLAQLRLKDVPDWSQVEYAVLEQNGQLSVILKSPAGADNSAAGGADNAGAGGKLCLPLIVNGALHKSNLARLSISPADLRRRLRGVKVRDVLLYTASGDGEGKIVMKEK